MLISSLHRQRYEQYYAGHASLVVRPHHWQPLVDQLVVDVSASSVLDYGCGLAGNLARFAPYPVQSYDPGVPVFAGRPTPADVVVCVHTLEHVELDTLTAVLWDIWRLARKAIFCTVSCQSSTKMLPDGTPWHTIVQSPAWWQTCLDAIWNEATPSILHSGEDEAEYRGLWFLVLEKERHSLAQRDISE